MAPGGEGRQKQKICFYMLKTMLVASVSWRRGLVLALILILAEYVSATYFTHSDVTELTVANFDKLVVNSDGVALVHFYAPFSSHCKNLASRMNSVAANLKGIALVGAVDCSDREASGNLCQRYNVRGFPAIKLFGPDRTKNPYTGEVMKEPADYTGDRTSKDLAESVTRMLSDVHVSRIRNAADLKEMRYAAEAAGKPQVLLFTDKEGVTSLYKGLSMQLRRALAFGLVHLAAAEVVREFEVAAFPTLLVAKVGGGIATYTGEIKAPALREFLLGFVGSETTAPTGDHHPDGSSGADGEEGAGGAGKAAAWAFVRQVEGLDELHSLEAREDMALLAVYGAEGEEGCKNARQAFLTAAGEMQAVVDTLLVSVPAADLTHGSVGARTLSRIGVEVSELAENPCELQVVLLPFGKDKVDSDIRLRYTGPPDGKELQRWVTDEFPNLVSEFNDLTATEILTADPSDGQIGVAPKVLLFTNKDEAPGVFRALAVALRGRGNLAFGWVQASSPGSRTTMQTFKPPRVPSMLVVLPTIQPDEEDPSEQRLRFGVQPYMGPLKYNLMKAFLEQLALQVEENAGLVKDPEVVRKALPQITTQTEFQSYCTEPAGMCMLALLDSAAVAFEGERKHLLSAALQHSRTSGGALHFAWLDAPKHRSVMQTFGVFSSDLPVLVALSARRMRFALLQSSGSGGDGGSDSSRGPRLRPHLVASFLTEVLSAKIKTTPLQGLPTVLERDESSDTDAAGRGTDTASAAAQQKQQQQEQIVEEEFDLSEILSEEVEGGAVVAGTKSERLQEIEEQLKAEEEEAAARQAAEKAEKAKSSKKKKKKKGSGKKKGQKGGAAGGVSEEL